MAPSRVQVAGLRFPARIPAKKRKGAKSTGRNTLTAFACKYFVRHEVGPLDAPANQLHMHGNNLIKILNKCGVE